MIDLGSKRDGCFFAGLLCLLPSVGFGFPSSEGLVEWLIALPFLIAFSGVPQIAMLVVSFVSLDRFSRLASLWISSAAVVVFFLWLSQVDLTSSSTGVLSILFFQIMATPVALVVLWAARFLRSVLSEVA